MRLSNPPLAHEDFLSLWFRHETSKPWETATETERAGYRDRASNLGDILHVARDIISAESIKHPLIDKLASLMHLVDTPKTLDPMREITVEDFPGIKEMTENLPSVESQQAKDGYFKRMKKDFI